MMFDVTGKVALITGGSGGIGVCIAQELLRNKVKGVALLDIDTVSGQKAVEELNSEFSKDSAIFINTDVSQRIQFEEAFTKAIQRFGHLDIVINNAGVVDEFQWEKCIAVNLQGCVTGSLLAIDKFFPTCLSTDEGIILNVSSTFAIREAPETPVYNGTKAGVMQFSKSLSSPFRCHNLKVKILTICPAATSTSILYKSHKQMHEELMESLLETVKSLPSQTPGELASHVLSIIKEGRNGSVWIVESNARAEIVFPKVI